MLSYQIESTEDSLKTTLQEICRREGYRAAFDFFRNWESGLPNTAGVNSENAILWELADSLRKWLKEHRNEFTMEKHY